MTHASKVLTDELAYLRSAHETATKQGATAIANDIGSDIADCEAALEVLTPRADCGKNITPI